MTRASNARHAAGSIEHGLLLKCVAGVLGGFGLAIAASKFHVVMWLVPPLWIAVVSAAFLFRGAARAFVWLAVANVAAFALVLVCQRWPV